MSRSPLSFGSLRRIFRPRRAPRPREQEWLRLILLVRRLQHGQLAFAQRLDEIRVLTVALGSFRSDLGALHEQLAAARLSAGELERGLAERLQRLDGLADPARERALLEQRLATLDGLTGRLETLAGQAPSTGPAARSDAAVAQLEQLAARLEAAQGPSAFAGQDELARLYDRMLELSEGLAHRPPPVDLSDSAFARDAGARLVLISQQLDKLHEALARPGSDEDAPVQGDALARIEKLVQRLDRRSAGPGSAKELTALLNRFEALALRLEQAPAALPELPAETIAPGPDPETQRALEELRVALLCEQESRRRVEAELEASRERLRASELARVELDTRHTSELAQMADHVGRQLARVEEDLKKKKRGLAELTQQNIALQAQLARVQGSGPPPGSPGEPPPALPSSGAASLGQTMQPRGTFREEP